MKHCAIAIDGPSGAGKSTISREMSKRLGILHIDTGAIYRAIGLYFLEKGIASDDEDRITEHLGRIEPRMTFEEGVQRVFIGGRDVTDLIRTPEVSKYASDVSALGQVRAFLLEIQRDIAKNNSVIMDGRDIGTVVLPSADLKIFLSAHPEVRARRRFEELVQKGLDVDYEDILAATVSRDYNDSNRANAPLKAAEDAVMIDTSGYSLERSLDMVEQIIRERLEQCF